LFYDLNVLIDRKISKMSPEIQLIEIYEC
jgi:hypothetical protein